MKAQQQPAPFLRERAVLSSFPKHRKLLVSLSLHMFILCLMILGIQYHPFKPTPLEIEVIWDPTQYSGPNPGDSQESEASVSSSSPASAQAANAPSVLNTIALPEDTKGEVAVNNLPSVEPSTPPQDPVLEKLDQEQKVDPDNKRVQVLDDDYRPTPEEMNQAATDSLASVAAGQRAIDRAKVVSPQWQHALGTWLQEHRKYPQDAIDRKEQGIAVVKFIVNKAGWVRDVHLVQSTGFPSLDAAVLKMLKGARVPPFPAGMTQEEVSVPIQIKYLLED